MKMISTKFNTTNKFFLRENWNKPLIKFLARKNADRLVYLGLPSPDAEDIQHWIDFIKIVIAFQCREYNKQSSPEQERSDIEKLEELLRGLERQQKLESYVVYDGYLEEVVFKRFDNSPNRITFEINNLITLYNLDFCNDVSSPIEYLDESGEVMSAFKFDAIKEILRVQNTISKLSNKFVFLLTVHCSYNGKELESFFNNPPNSIIKDYLKKYHSLSGVEKNSRIVKLFVTYLIQNYFSTYNFTPKILPVIRYNGIHDTPLLHFVVLGIHSSSSAGAPTLYQPFDEVINQSFVEIKDDSFVLSPKIFDEEVEIDTNPVNFFTQSKTYDKLWR